MTHLISWQESLTISVATFFVAIFVGIIIKRYVIRGTAYVVATYDPVRIGWVVFLGTMVPLAVRTPFLHIIFGMSLTMYFLTYTWTMLSVLGIMLGYAYAPAIIAHPKPLKGGLSVDETGELHVIPPIENTKHPTREDEQ